MALNSITPLSNGNSCWPTIKPTSVTIIVAATKSMGMGYNTHLPWPKLKRESNYFEMMTKRTISKGAMNAIIMGYTTWYDEPTKLYPDRINVVVTREPAKVWNRIRDDNRKGFIHVATSVEEAVELLERIYSYPPEKERTGDDSASNGHGNIYEESENCVPLLGRIFVIGGAELCRHALEYPWVNRLLLTRVMADFKSDNFFPLVLDGRGNEQWRRQSDSYFQQWGGPDIPIGIQCENGIEWEAFMFERV